MDEKENIKKLLPCPLCGKKADSWYMFDIARAGCSDGTCPCAFGDDGIDADLWNKRASNDNAFKEVAIEFYSWWNNHQFGNTAEHGFDEWWKLNKERLIG